ncbi:hypothetical protein Hanom_Chr11g01032051 [Helianthus anomalus]
MDVLPATSSSSSMSNRCYNLIPHTIKCILTYIRFNRSIYQATKKWLLLTYETAVNKTLFSFGCHALCKIPWLVDIVSP